MFPKDLKEEETGREGKKLVSKVTFIKFTRSQTLFRQTIGVCLGSLDGVSNFVVGLIRVSNVALE